MKKLNYISLFSSAGVGCFAFKELGYECLATCEINEKRMNIQKINNKCLMDSGYIIGDISDKKIQNKIIEEIKKHSHDIHEFLDVLIATPPCQGMSVANQKKGNEIVRNSLVVSAIEIINKIKPKIFIFENVQKFLTTDCTGIDGKNRIIKDEINRVLSEDYIISSKIINFKNYGSNSSRTRTLVIGVHKNHISKITPFEIFPEWTQEKKLKEVIGNFTSLKKFDEIDPNNIFHHFKKYDPRVLDWIKDLKEGETAFENRDIHKRPHKIINNQIVEYVNIFGDKYKRQEWNKVAPCIHTANDCLASQNTIHPSDNRVFSIAELMEMMSIPKTFKWTNDEIEKMNYEQKINWLYKNQSNIRKCIGEAVPTGVFFRIAKNIKNILNNYDNFFERSKEYELKNSTRKEEAAYYTDRINLAYIYNLLPDFKKEEINILEPSAGAGNFLLPLIKKYDTYKKINVYVNDINENSLKFIKNNIDHFNINEKFNFIFSKKDFLDYDENIKFDLIVGNPPFQTLKKNNKNINYVEEFWKKGFNLSSNIYFVNPKYILTSTKYEQLRKFLKTKNVENIIDFGELGFKNVKIETIFLSTTYKKNNLVNIYSVPRKIFIKQQKNYIFDEKLPHWIIYRSYEFDDVFYRLKRGIFEITKNYEISNRFLTKEINENSIWVVKSKNISINLPSLEHKKNYDRYISKELVNDMKIYEFINKNDDLFLIPNLTYYPRVIRMPKNIIVNGSVLIAKVKDDKIKIKEKDLIFFYTDEFRTYYRIAFNYSTRTLNIDNNTIDFFGVLKRDEYKI